MWAVPAAVVVLSALIAIGVGLRQRADNVALEQTRFQVLAGRVVTQLNDRFQTYELGLRGVRGAMQATGVEEISRERFRAYGASFDIRSAFPGALGFGIVRRVEPSAEAAFVAAARAEGRPDFAVQPFAPHAGERFVIQYIEPIEQNEPAIGLDIASEPNRREAAVRSMRSGLATLSAPIDLFQRASEDRRGFLLFLPVQRSGMPLATEAERERATVGWAYARVSVAGVLKGFDFQEGTFAIRITDASRVNTPAPVFATARYQVSGALPTFVARRSVFGRKWLIELAATPAFIAQLQRPSPLAKALWALIVGILLSGLLYLYLSSIERRLLESVERDRLAAIVASSGDAIIAKDISGIITFWNAGAEHIFGYSALEMVGQPLARLSAQIQVQQDDPSARLPSERAQQVQTADGKLVSVAITESPIRDANGIVVGTSVIARDTSRRERVEVALRESERRFRDLAESLPQLVFTCAGDGSCDYLSPQWVDYTGIPAATQLGDAWLQQLHPDDVAETMTRWADAAGSGGRFDVEFRIRRHDGAYRWFKTRATPTRDETGRISKWIGSNTDIQDLRDAQDANQALARALEERVLARTRELGTANAKLVLLAKELEAAQHIARVGSWSLDVTSGRVVWSDELFRIMELDPARGAPDYLDQQRLFTQESWHTLNAAVSHCLATGIGYELRLELPRREGGNRIGIARSEVVRDESGAIAHLVGTLQDITDTELVRVQLEQLSGRMQLATSAAEIGVWDWDVRNNVLVWDENMHRLYDTSTRSFTGIYDAWQAALHPADRAEGDAAIQDALSGTRDFKPSFRIVRPSGEVRYMRAAATVQRDPSSGEPVRMVGVNWDVTEQRLVVIALQSSEALQRAILTHAGSAIIATDPAGTITLFNRAAELLLGYEADEVIAKSTPAIFHDLTEVDARRAGVEAEGLEVASPFDVLVARSRLGKADANEWTYVRKDGAPVRVLLTVSTLRDHADQIFGYLGIAVDLKLQKQHETELRELNRLLAERTAQAESANHAKSMFLANMSHEIRTPIGAITGITYLLGRSALSADQKGLVRTIERSSRSLLGMINDVLDLSKVEAGQLSLDATPFVMSSVLDDVAGLMAGYATGKELELVVDAHPELPESLVGDRMRLIQILTNLVGNAIKFTANGTVRLHVFHRATEDDHARSWLHFEVDDTGPGMDEMLMQRLFTPFTQGAQSTLQRAGGTGLGLAIVKQLVTMMGGTVSVESRVGVGSHFRCAIPFERGADETRSGFGRALRVLVVDDNDAQRHALVSHVERAGGDPLSASSGEQALAAMREASRRGQAIDSVIVDAKMPGMDGFELLAALRKADADDFPQPGVILQTGYDLTSVRERPESRMADALVSKPVTPTALFDAIATADRRRARAGILSSIPPRGVTSQRLAGLRVLVVDDSDVNCDIARRILEVEGAVVQMASNGKQAVARLLTARELYDVVLMDVQMPEMDGVEAARQIRGDTQQAALPIIALTAGALATDRQRALDVGMNAYISKPFEPDSLIASIRGQLERFTAAASIRPARRDTSSRSEAWPSISGVDVGEARLRFSGNLKFYRELLERTLVDFDQLHERLSAPIDSDVSSSCSEHVHKLAGIAGNIGARMLMDRANAVARALHARQPRDREAALTALLPELAHVRESVREALTRWPVSTELYEPPEAASAAADLQTWSSFLHELRAQDLRALPSFSRLSASLVRRVGTLRHEQLRVAMTDLDFAKALVITAGVDASEPPLGV